MSTPTFTDLLRTAVAAMQAAHPERLGEIARAHAAIVEGHVVPVDADNGQVLSRNGHTWYAVNGTCACQAASFGKPCRHLQAWKLYKHIEKQHAALLPEAPPVLPAPATTPAPVGPLPEAPASVNVHLTIAGRQVQLTLRDMDETRLLARLDVVLQRFPLAAPTLLHTPTAPPSPVCPWHGAMKESTKATGTWYCPAKMADGAYCQSRHPEKGR